jgi:hypothetical protein
MLAVPDELATSDSCLGPDKRQPVVADINADAVSI